MDENEFKEFYPQLSRLIDFYALKYCYKKDGLDDFRQELWLKLWLSYKNVYEKDHSSGANPVTWASHTLKLAAKQVAYDKSIQTRFEQESIIPTEYPLEELEVAEEIYDNPIGNIDLSEIRKCLSPKQKEVFDLILEYRYNMSDQNKLNFNQIAVIAGINKKTMYEHLVKIRNKLRYILPPNYLSDKK